MAASTYCTGHPASPPRCISTRLCKLWAVRCLVRDDARTVLHHFHEGLPGDRERRAVAAIRCKDASPPHLSSPLPLPLPLSPLCQSAREENRCAVDHTTLQALLDRPGLRPRLPDVGLDFPSLPSAPVRHASPRLRVVPQAGGLLTVELLHARSKLALEEKDEEEERSRVTRVTRQGRRQQELHASTER